MRISIILILFLAEGSICLAQESHFTKNGHWKGQSKEFIIGVGTSNLLSDLGGRDYSGKNYSLADLETSMFRLGGHIGFRFRMRPMWATTSSLQYGLLAGNDRLTNIPNRRYRNFNIRTHLFEYSQRLELILYRHENFGHRFKRIGFKRDTS